jgi:LysR family transcriptional regulator, transcriptional activator of the cysJI operon
MRIPKLDPYHLIVFYCVAKEKSITAAARSLCITQPAVSRHIKSLEKSTGLKLIQVAKQRIALTPAGEGLYQSAKEIYQQSIIADRLIEITRESSFSIGITPCFKSIINPIVENIVRELSPKVEFSVESKESHFLTSSVLDSTIDLAIIATSQQRDSRLNYVSIADDIKLVFFASPANPIFQKERVEWSDLSDHRLITGSDGSIVLQLVKNKLKEEGLNVDLRGPHVMNNAELTRRLIVNGDFLGITFQKYIDEQVKNGALRIITFPDDISIDASIIFYRNKLLSPMVKRLIPLAREAFVSFGESR